MDAQERALHQTIRAHPADDGPRLVYADWLEEHGDCALAEFIRVQLQRSALDAYDPRQQSLARRERELIDDHKTEWVGLAFRLFGHYQSPPEEPVFEPLDPAATREMTRQPRWHFRRGFPWAEVSAAQFLAHCEMLLDAAPVVQLHVGPDSPKEFVQRSSEPRSLRSRRELFHELLASPDLPRCSLGLTLVDESDWEQLAQHGRHLRLAALHALGANAYVWHLRELARAPGLDDLGALVLHQINLTDPVARELAACPFLAQLHTLDLRGNHLGPEGIAALTSVAADRLRYLDLSDNPIGDGGAAQLARWPGLAGVEVLRLEGCGLGPQGIAALAASPHWQRLSQLGLQRNQVRGAGVAALTALGNAPWLGRLARLDLCGNHIGGVGAQHLTLAAPLLRQLRRLYLSMDRDDLSDHHLHWLAEAFDERLLLDWFHPPR